MDRSTLTTWGLQVLPKRIQEEIDLTWTGRGRKPHWVIRWLDEGKATELAVRLT